MAHLHDRLGGVARLALGHLAHPVLVVVHVHIVVRVPRLVPVVVALPPLRAVHVGAHGTGEGRAVDGKPLLRGAGQLQTVPMTRHPGLELGGLALEGHLDVLPVAGAGVLGVEQLGAGDHGAELLAVALLLDVLQGLGEAAVQVHFRAGVDQGVLSGWWAYLEQTFIMS